MGRRGRSLIAGRLGAVLLDRIPNSRRDYDLIIKGEATSSILRSGTNAVGEVAIADSRIAAAEPKIAARRLCAGAHCRPGVRSRTAH